jgi:hypothetical protein
MLGRATLTGSKRRRRLRLRDAQRTPHAFLGCLRGRCAVCPRASSPAELTTLAALGPLGARPPDAFDQLGREARVGDVGRTDPLLQLEATSIVPGRDLVLGRRMGHDDDAWHELLPFGSTRCTQNVRPTGFRQPLATANPPPQGDIADPTRLVFARQRHLRHERHPKEPGPSGEFDRRPGGRRRVCCGRAFGNRSADRPAGNPAWGDLGPGASVLHVACEILIVRPSLRVGRGPPRGPRLRVASANPAPRYRFEAVRPSTRGGKEREILLACRGSCVRRAVLAGTPMRHWTGGRRMATVRGGSADEAGR